MRHFALSVRRFFVLSALLGFQNVVIGSEILTYPNSVGGTEIEIPKAVLDATHSDTGDGKRLTFGALTTNRADGQCADMAGRWEGYLEATPAAKITIYLERVSDDEVSMAVIFGLDLSRPSLARTFRLKHESQCNYSSPAQGGNEKGSVMVEHDKSAGELHLFGKFSWTDHFILTRGTSLTISPDRSSPNPNSNRSVRVRAKKTVAGNASYWPDTAWRASTPEAQDIDSGAIRSLIAEIREMGYAIDSFMLVRNGYLVAEEYFSKREPNKRHEMYSMTKSVTSAVLGIAIDEGLLPGTQTVLSAYFPEAMVLPDKAEITVEQLLTMTAGFPGIEKMTSAELIGKKNTVSWLLGMPLKNKGTFQYNNPSPHLVSAIIGKQAGMNTGDYAQKKLFDPLGIEEVNWPTDGDGNSVGGAGLSLTPFELSKFGYLYLMNGLWNGKRIVSEKWIAESTSTHVEGFDMNDAERDGYGYFWWINSFGGYSAHGAGGQFVFVLPNLDMVAVFTANLFDGNFAVPYRLMEKHVLPATH